MMAISSKARPTAICAVAILLIAAGVGLWFWSIPSEAARDRAYPEDLGQVALGETVYRTHCAACHGTKLEGQPNWRERKPDGKLPATPHDENGHTWHHGDEILFRLTKRGVKPPLAPDGYRRDIPAFDGVMTDAQTWAALAFIKSKWPLEIRGCQERINQALRQRQRERENGK